MKKQIYSLIVFIVIIGVGVLPYVFSSNDSIDSTEVEPSGVAMNNGEGVVTEEPVPCSGPFEDSYYVAHVESGRKLFINNCGLSSIYLIHGESKTLLFQSEREQYRISTDAKYFSPEGNYLTFFQGIPETDGRSFFILDTDTGQLLEGHRDLEGFPLQWFIWSEDDSFLVIVDFSETWGDDDLYVSEIDNPEKLRSVFVTDPDTVTKQVDKGSVVIDGNEVRFTVRKFTSDGWLDDNEDYIYNAESGVLENVTNVN